MSSSAPAAPSATAAPTTAPPTPQRTRGAQGASPGSEADVPLTLSVPEITAILVGILVLVCVARCCAVRFLSESVRRKAFNFSGDVEVPNNVATSVSSVDPNADDGEATAVVAVDAAPAAPPVAVAGRPHASEPGTVV